MLPIKWVAMESTTVLVNAVERPALASVVQPTEQSLAPVTRIGGTTSKLELSWESSVDGFAEKRATCLGNQTSLR